MEQIVREIEALRVKKGETVFLRPSKDMTMAQVEELSRQFQRASLDCQVVVLTADLKVEAVAE